MITGYTRTRSAKLEKCMLRFCHFQLVMREFSRLDFTSIGSKACADLRICCLFIKIKHN
jgi:hypothetical protein